MEVKRREEMERILSDDAENDTGDY